MKLPFYQYIVLLFVIFTSVYSYAQQKIEIRRSGFLNFDEDNYPGARILTRDDSEQVHIFHNGTDMWCDKAYYYGNENSIEAFGNVKMVQGDTIKMTSKYVQYSGATQLAFASGDVILTNPDSKISTDTLYFDRERQQAFYRSNGTVEIDTTGTIVSKIGRYYAKEKKYKFVEDVVLTNPDAKIETNYFDFYDELKHAYLFGPSIITTDESVTYCEKGFYDTQAKTGYAMKNAKIDYEGKEILGDSIYFDQNKNFSSATNNIKVTDTLNKSIVKGHYTEVFRAKDSIFITKRAVAITLQEKDSIYIHGDTLMVTGKPEKRITRAFRNVKIYKSDLSGKADSIHANHATGLTQLININKSGSSGAFSTARKPILWNLGNQMTGDTIHLQSDTEKDKLDSLIVFNQAALTSKDTLGTGYNQINGKKLVGLFNEDNEIYNVDIIKNAQVIYYLRNENGELTGIDKSKSGLINIKINDNAIEEVRKINQIDGKVYPESQFPKNERILKGFDWREEERPLSVEDLFKDDPPLNLPTIKGLDDYVPEDDFFQTKLDERIKKSIKPRRKNGYTLLDKVISNNAQVILNVQVSAQDNFQIFYTFDDVKSFKEKHSIRKVVLNHENSVNLTFDFPENIIPENLRIDVGSNREQERLKINSIFINYKKHQIYIPGNTILDFFEPNRFLIYNEELGSFRLKTIKIKNTESYDPYFISTKKLIDLLSKFD
ncbi:MAG: OstA-like protein [Jejuia sp.]